MNRLRLSIVVMVVTAVATVAVSCGNATQKQNAKSVETGKKQGQEQVAYLPNLAFKVRQAHVGMSVEQQREYYAEHFWDEFDFADEAFVESLDNTKMSATLLMSIACCSTPDTAVEYLEGLMRRTVVSKPVMQYFLTLGERMFYDPNSPYRNDEFYIPMLRVALESGLLDEYERMPYQSDLRIVSQNRVGHKANDFELTLASGRILTLYGIESPYTLLFISNPGCPMCRDVKEDILSSQLLSDMVLDGELTVVVLYPDEDLEAWRAALKEYPSEWINGYDARLSIEANDLYDLKAIPSLYLFDDEKRVLVKDEVSVALIEQIVAESQEL